MHMYAFMRVEKVKSFSHIVDLGRHIERRRPTPNADPARRYLNERLCGSGNWLDDVYARLAVLPTVERNGVLVPKVRKNGVLALEHLQTASPGFFEQGSQWEQLRRRNDWRDRNMEWLYQTYGPANVVAAVLHLDERTPHIQSLVVPIDPRGRLNARHYVGGSSRRLVALQDSYHAAVRDLGLERGVYKSVIRHEEIKEFYLRIHMAMNHDLTRELVHEIRIDSPGRFVAHPQEYVEEQQRRMVALIGPRIQALDTVNRHLSWEVERQQRQISAQAERERNNRAMLDELRRVDLEHVMNRLGGERDRHDRHKWRLGDEVYSINEKHDAGAGRIQVWYSHSEQRGGGGAIDLVMHAQRYDFAQSVAYLRDEIGTGPAISAAMEHARGVAAREPAPPFHAPEQDVQRWQQVHRYLTEERALPSEWIDELHDRGKVYADRRGNAVFIRESELGQATGAYLRGTMPGSTFAGLAAGTRREAGWFSYELPGKEGVTPALIVAESPIDGLSRMALQRRAMPEAGRLTVVSTDGMGGWPHPRIQETLRRNGRVQIATDRDPAGEKIWEEIRKQYAQPSVVRDRPPLKDWNDVLRNPERARAVQRELASDGTRAAGRAVSRVREEMERVRGIAHER